VGKKFLKKKLGGCSRFCFFSAVWKKGSESSLIDRQKV
jgi:hypothetical protein